MSSTPNSTAIVIHPVFAGRSSSSAFESTPEDYLEEACDLTRAINLEIAHSELINIPKIAPGYLFSKGGREKMQAYAEEKEPDIVIINHPLSPVQQRNLEKFLNTKVIDRTGLILEIFGARAQTSEGKIQVELAALEYQKSRLVRSWTHLERQRGGAGFMGGPGETQIEIDRRLISGRITKLKKELEHVRKTRDIQKRSREKVPFPIVSLVGYTNAGKSTLFNKITNADVFAEDLLFATLDPTMRKTKLENGQEIILADTVGFIRDLPTHLVAAFRATLEHVIDAHIILHIMDVSHSAYKEQRANVIKIMEDLGVDYETDKRIIEVYNKIDALEDDDKEFYLHKAKFKDNIIAVSGVTGENIYALMDAISARLQSAFIPVRVEIPYKDGRAIAWIHEHSTVNDIIDGESTLTLDIDISQRDLGRFHEMFEYAID